MLPMKKNSQYLVVNCSKLSRRSRSRIVTRTSCLSWDGSQSAPNVLISLITHKRWRISHRANSNCAMAWGTPSPGAPGLDALWHRLWRTVLRCSPAVNLFGVFCCVNCARWENALNSSFTVHDDLIKYRRIRPIWGSGPHGIWHWAYHKLHPALPTNCTWHRHLLLDSVKLVHSIWTGLCHFQQQWKISVTIIKKLVLENDDNFVIFHIFIEKFFSPVAVA